VSSTPYGYVITVLLTAVATGLAVLAPRRPPRLGRLSSGAGVVVGELTAWVMLWLVGSTALLVLQGGVHGVLASAAVGVAAVVLVVLARELALARRADPALRAALADAPARSVRAGTVRSLLFPLPLRPRSVSRARGISYGPLPHQRFDVYSAGAADGPLRPVLVQLHGGGFVGGRRSRESLSLLYLLARQGWVCLSADYRLARTPDEGHPGHLVDVKALIAWLRTDGHRIGADPSTLVLVGTSAGAHLAAMAALTAGDPRYQPGFESADTSVSGFVGLAGYYGPVTGEGDGSSPFDHLGAATTPPALLVHGSRDSQTSPADAELLARRLREQSDSCGFALLPGGTHTLDLLDSIRFHSVARATTDFCQGLLDQAR
jgi:acetyl esterase/lipase